MLLTYLRGSHRSYPIAQDCIARGRVSGLVEVATGACKNGMHHQHEGVEEAREEESIDTVVNPPGTAVRPLHRKPEITRYGTD